MKVLVEHVTIYPESFKDKEGKLNQNTMKEVIYNLENTDKLYNVKADYINFCYSYDKPVKEGTTGANVHYIDV